MKFSKIQYTRPDFDDILSKMDVALEKSANATNSKTQIEALDDLVRLYDTFNTNYALVRIRHFLDTNDEFYKNELKFILQNLPMLKLKYSKIENDILNSPFKACIESKIGSVAMTNFALNNKTISSDVVSDMSEESILVSEYVRIISNLSVDFLGENIPLTMLAPYKESTDRNIRKKALIAEGEAYNTVKGTLDDIFDKLVKNRTAQAKKLGFNNYVELGYARMGRNCYTNKEIGVFRNEVLTNIVPIVNEVFQNRKKRLELFEIYYYDIPLPFKDGAPKPQVSGEGIINAGKKLYHEMSKETARFIDVMISSELIDVYPKLGKSPGGFCSYLSDYNYPFIFANFNETATDVYVFTHEIGHALSKYLTGKDIEYSYTTMDISETHSMAMEFLTSPWHELFFKDETAKYKLSHAENALIFIPYACQVDEFQEQIYLNPDLTPLKRDELWLKIEKKYRPFLSEDDLPFYSNGAGWQRQSHIYKTPFYYIDYALAQIMAIQFFALFLKDKEDAYNLYFEFLSLSNKKTFVDLIDTLNLASPLKEGKTVEIIQKFYDYLKEINI